MFIHQKSNMKRSLLLLSSLTLLLLLAACSTGSTASAPTPTPTPKPTPTPSGTVYNGNAYTLKYPQDWKLETQSTATGVVVVAIVPSSGDQNTAFTITVTAAVPGANLDGAVTGGLNSYKSQLSNYQQDTSVASSVKIGGDTWKQGGATGDSQGTKVKGVVIVDQHPASTGKLFIITLGAPASSYDLTDTSVFQSILQSFKFA